MKTSGIRNTDGNISHLQLTLEGAVLAVPAIGAETRSVGAHAVL